MVKQPYTCECHCDAVFVTRVDHMIVTDGTACLCDIIYAAFVCSFDIVTEGEKGVGAHETPLSVSSQARFSSRVRISGFSVKNRCQIPSAKTLRGHR